MELLPNEIIISIAQSVQDIMSLGRWSQTNHHYSAVLTDNLIWQPHFKRDFPTVLINHEIPSWRELYCQQIDVRQQFYREFPDFLRVGDWVMPRFSNGWVDVYQQARRNPILLQPAINRIYHEIKSQIPTATLTFNSQYPSDPQVECPVIQRYLLNLSKIHPHLRHHRQDVISFIITVSSKVRETRAKVPSFLEYFSNLSTKLIIGTNDDMDMLSFDGYLIQQSNGAHIWFPLCIIYSNTRWPYYRPLTFSQLNTDYVDTWSPMMVI